MIDESIDFYIPTKGFPFDGRAPRRDKRGRRLCMYDGCETILSSYNRANTCWVHTPYRHHRADRGQTHKKKAQ